MRPNLEDARAHRLRMFATRRPGINAVLAGTFVVPTGGPEVYMFDAGSGTKVVRLPALTEELSVLIANIGAANSLDVYDANNVLQISIRTGELKYFFAGPSRWVWMSANFVSVDPTGVTEELRVVVGAGTQTIGATEAGLALNKTIASVTPINLPSVTLRAGKPVRVIDWAGNVDVTNLVTFTPSGAEKINNQATWDATNLSSGGIVLFPNTTLNGWTVGA